jgi:hypothetical protein
MECCDIDLWFTKCAYVSIGTLLLDTSKAEYHMSMQYDELVVCAIQGLRASLNEPPPSSSLFPKLTSNGKTHAAARAHGPPRIVAAKPLPDALLVENTGRWIHFHELSVIPGLASPKHVVSAA